MYDWGALSQKSNKELDRIITETEDILYQVEQKRASKINKVLYLQQRILEVESK